MNESSPPEPLDHNRRSPPENAEEASVNSETRPLVVSSDSVLQGRREIWIQHGEEMYRLRLTAAGKLYLSK